MAHVPESVEDTEEAPPIGDPVVRAPKAVVVLPEPAEFGRRTMFAVAVLGLMIGAALGAVGIGIVYATHAPAAIAAPTTRATRGTRPSNAVTGDGGVVLLALGSDASAADAAVPTGPEARWITRQQRLGRGRTLPLVLRSLGVPNDVTTRVVRALRTLVNMRSLQPGDVIATVRDPDNGDQLRRIELRRSITEVYAATTDSDGTWQGQHLQVEHTTVRVAAGFRVSGTLEDALREAHLQPDIVSRLQEVFPTIDLGRELRQGDTVRLIVQEERLNGTFFRYGRVEAVEYRGAMGRRRAFYQQLSPRTGDFFDASGRTWDRGPLRPPVVPARLSSPFNLRRMHPVLHRIMPHLGADFGAPMGAPVYAAADGTVIHVGSGGPAGNLVRISHAQLGVETGYAHLSRFAPGLRSGQSVRVHQLVGYVGSTGRSTGPHLHFSLKRSGQFIDPMTMCSIRRSVPEALRSEFAENMRRAVADLEAIRITGEEPAPPPEPAAADDHSDDTPEAETTDPPTPEAAPQE